MVLKPYFRHPVIKQKRRDAITVAFDRRFWWLPILRLS